MEDFFSVCCQEIESAYLELGHRKSWRFLYTSARTLSPSSKLWFIGLNPGGDAYEPPSSSVEMGNAFLVESWNGCKPGSSPLQIQVQKLFHLVAQNSPQPIEVASLMNKSLFANLVPFRSKNWGALERKSESIQFSVSLWKKIFTHIEPKVIITMSNITNRHLRDIAAVSGYCKDNDQVQPIGWGKTSYSIERLANTDKKLDIVRLPHLSTFKIFSRTRCKPAMQTMIDEIGDLLNAKT
ncbi:MAG: hypothetical protein HY541_00895 [Deltaproteobacteria bacterium]|nr:hypothetical protein [Deltaproteobacteria bacterium]